MAGVSSLTGTTDKTHRPGTTLRQVERNVTRFSPAADDDLQLAKAPTSRPTWANTPCPEGWATTAASTTNREGPTTP